VGSVVPELRWGQDAGGAHVDSFLLPQLPIPRQARLQVCVRLILGRHAMEVERGKKGEVGLIVDVEVEQPAVQALL
jgi:hypothetical protein